MAFLENFSFEKIFILCIGAFCLLYVCVARDYECQVKKSEEGIGVLGCWSYRWLGVTTRRLGSTTRSSGRAASIGKQGTLIPHPQLKVPLFEHTFLVYQALEN